jgi:hypothetical protein
MEMVHGRRALSARNRDPVMAVDDEVDVADAIEIDGRKPARPDCEILEAFPPLPQLFLARKARLNSRSRCTVPTIRSRGTSCIPRSTTWRRRSRSRT